MNMIFANYLYQNADFLDTAPDTVQYTHQYWIFLLPLIGAVADIATGWIQASINNCWKSVIMRKGLYRKSGEPLSLWRCGARLLYIIRESLIWLPLWSQMLSNSTEGENYGR